MKINLESLKYLYDIEKENSKEKMEENEIKSFEDFKNYILNTIIENIEYDFFIDFSDYVDMNNFVERSDINE